VALQREEELLGSFTLFTDRSHAEQLATLTDHLLNSCNLKFRDVASIAVSAGPGSYTGLRIGTSFAKGLCYALEIPLITLGSLLGMAEAIRRFVPPGALIISMMDARRMEVYLQVFDHDLKMLEKARPFLLEEESLESFLEKGTCYFIGNGSDKARSVVTHENAVFIEGVNAEARHMCRHAWQRFREGDFTDLAYFEPEYLKEFRATKPKKLL